MMLSTAVFLLPWQVHMYHVQVPKCSRDYSILQ